MKEKRMGSTGRREELKGRGRKGIYSQRRHVRLHEKELVIQEPWFLHLFPKAQPSLMCTIVLSSPFPWHLWCSPCCPTRFPLHPHLLWTPSCLPPDPLSQLSSAGCICIFLTLHSQPLLRIILNLWSGRLWGASTFGLNSTWNSSQLERPLCFKRGRGCKGS